MNTRSLLSLVADRRSFRLADAFAAITDRTARLSILNLVEKIAAAVAAPQVARIRARFGRGPPPQ
jgi:hypothetical protein